ncbi:MAG: RusA family crossover junction endodeoxyribonuclease [Candidatus Paraimprobicoccus trichonymphae]|uniref:RusA family crossover junction endodeoxyribonuclease n=1 Tax=Candidatus Paraimprobicoccus trichonymphae TaxID=3033793 RepID=A0AA48I5Q8_9FIRM|nr:MAG: RusA family crossover junction endodeoxyribonuclease [Candidatus Paraimprobicoccus trichonymphae]
MMIKFTVLGHPIGKQRPRMCQINGCTIAYTPKQTKEYERLIRLNYKKVLKIKFEKGVPLEAEITAFFAVPKAASKRVKEAMLNEEILPTKKSDGDNITKIILDALNGVAYHDDSQICNIIFKKKFGEVPKVVVMIRKI